MSLSPWRAVRNYIAHPDPLVAAGNLIAVVVAWNQPIYPLYLYLFVSRDIGVSFLTFLSTPFFIAVPVVARCNSLAGRALLPLIGIANTVLSAKAFGEASGVELFFAPCIMIAAMLFRRSERAVMLVLLGLGLVTYVGLRGRYGAPLHLYSPDEYAAFLGVNALSVGTLSAFVGVVFSNVLADIESGPTGHGA
ncbi:MAG TPA: hypothetical protein VHY35_24470 [Stellaceae bacterium]|jgi:hypothetical protein|nr:hypothetical protein [Stellaceae bacterium]